MIFSPKLRPTRAVVIQCSKDENGKPGQFTQPGVVALIAGVQWVTGRDSKGRDVFQVPASDVALAFIEDVPNG